MMLLAMSIVTLLLNRALKLSLAMKCWAIDQHWFVRLQNERYGHMISTMW